MNFFAILQIAYQQLPKWSMLKNNLFFTEKKKTITQYY